MFLSLVFCVFSSLLFLGLHVEVRGTWGKIVSHGVHLI